MPAALSWTFSGFFIGITVICATGAALLTFYFFNQSLDQSGVLIALKLDQDWRIFDWAQTFSSLVIGLVFCLNLIWIYKASAAAISLRGVAGRLSLISPFWSVVYAFLPLVQYWMPFQAIRQLWNLSVRPEQRFDSAAPGFFWVWWLSLLGGFFLGQGAPSIAQTVAEEVRVAHYMGYSGIAWGLNTIAAVCFAYIQWSVSRRLGRAAA